MSFTYLSRPLWKPWAIGHLSSSKIQRSFHFLEKPLYLSVSQFCLTLNTTRGLIFQIAACRPTLCLSIPWRTLCSQGTGEISRYNHDILLLFNEAFSFDTHVLKQNCHFKVNLQSFLLNFSQRSTITTLSVISSVWIIVLVTSSEHLKLSWRFWEDMVSLRRASIHSPLAKLFRLTAASWASARVNKNSIYPSLLFCLDIMHKFGRRTPLQLQNIRVRCHCLVHQTFTPQLIALYPFLVKTMYFVPFGLKWVWRPSPFKHLSSRAKSCFTFRVLVNLIIWHCLYSI